MNIPLITNRQLAEGFVMALSETSIKTESANSLPAKSWEEYRSDK